MPLRNDPDSPSRDPYYPALPSQITGLTETLAGIPSPSEAVRIDPLAEQNRQLAVRVEQLERRLEEHAGRLQRLERTEVPDDGM